jgi:hypothetical protein
MSLSTLLQIQSLTISHIGIFYYLGISLLLAAAGVWKAGGEKQVPRGLALVFLALFIILVNLSIWGDKIAALSIGTLIGAFLLLISWAVLAVTALVQLRRRLPGKRTVGLFAWALVIALLPIVGALSFFAFGPSGYGEAT